jgi:hypothetical protein
LQPPFVSRYSLDSEIFPKTLGWSLQWHEYPDRRAGATLLTLQMKPRRVQLCSSADLLSPGDPQAQLQKNRRKPLHRS